MMYKRRTFDERFVRKDYSKRLLNFTKLLLRMICMWPENHHSFRKRTLFFWTAIFSCLFINGGLIAYFIHYVDDYRKSLNNVSSMSTIFQTTVKLTILYWHSDKLSGILNDIEASFWPASEQRVELNLTVRSYYMKGLYFMMFLGSSGVTFSIGFLFSPLVNSTSRDIPYKSIYPFEWKRSPTYEIIYFGHCVHNFYLVNLAVLGFDLLFMSICFNITEQYMLLGDVLEDFGTFEKYGIGRLTRVGSNRLHEMRRITCCENRAFLVACIEHHQLLSRISQDAEKVFNLAAVMQLGSSVIAICVSSFIATADDVSTAQLTTMGSYLIGHLIQLFLYCTLGNMLIIQSSQLDQRICCSNWYELQCIKCNKHLRFVIMKSQVSSRITAMKMFILDHQTFLKVVKMSFSFYTLLSTVTNK